MYCHSLQHAVQNCNQIVVNAISTMMEATNLSKKYLGFYRYSQTSGLYNKINYTAKSVNCFITFFIECFYAGPFTLTKHRY